MQMKNLNHIRSSNVTETLDLLYDLNDLLAKCRIFTNRLEQLDQSLSRLIPLKIFLFRRKVKPQLTRINDGFKQVVENRELVVEEVEKKRVQLGYFDTVHTSSEVDVSEIIEFDAHVEKVERLLGKREDGIRFTAIGIVGMGGVGKTALVQKIFNSPSVQEQFSKKVWICLSDILKEEIDVEVKIVKCILDELGRDTDEVTTNFGVVQLLENLSRHLSTERYLIVLDDVCHTHEFFNCNFGERKEEERLWYWLYKHCYGAVIVTSRKNDVAEYMVGEKNLVRLEPLSKERCWKIFDNTICKDGKISSDDPTVAKLKYEILDKCHGLPLVARDLAKLIGNGALIGRTRAVPSTFATPSRTTGDYDGGNNSEIKEENE